MAQPRKVVVVVTLAGTAEQLSSGLPNGLKLRAWSMQPGVLNANPIFLGGDNTVNATAYGVRLPKATAGEPPAPYMEEGFDDGTVAVEDVWVFGTSGEKLHLYLTVHGAQAGPGA